VNPPVDLSALADTDAEAERRFLLTRSADPFPAIPPALLNTADLLDYVVATGMIHPLAVDPIDPSETLKPASCAIPIAGPYVYWPDGEKRSQARQDGDLKRGETLELARNSIVFVTLEPIFRLPDYIAGRFNLTIREIYRGLLVGTGPLVDPGFQGRLSLPLHNLTENNYTIVGGELLVWMEFTKLSPSDRWSSSPSKTTPRTGSYVEFPKDKLDRRTVVDYVERAHKGPIRSSIPGLVESAVLAAEGAKKAAERTRNIIAGLSLAGVVVIAAFCFQAISDIQSAQKEASNSRSEVIELRQQIHEQARELQQLDAQLVPQRARK
jgi:hypothetical protein